MEDKREEREEKDYPLHLVLVNPEIPANTGNVARLCALTGAKLHLIRPLGFFLDDRRLKRAGLDYWDLLHVEFHDSLEELYQALAGHNFYYSSTKGQRSHSSVKYEYGDVILFGPETKGLARELLAAHPDETIRIPMLPVEEARSLNLGNSVAIIAYEALRQLGYPGLR